MVMILAMYVHGSSVISVSAANDDYNYDYISPQPFAEAFLKNGNMASYQYINMWTMHILNSDFIIKKDHHLRIESIGNSPDTMTDGRLVISGGAVLEVKGEIFIERDSVLEIEDGTVIINGGNVQNCGTIKIGKNGTLHVQKGILRSTAAGSIENNGAITCTSSKRDLGRTFKSIEKYDNRFNLSDYSVLIDCQTKNSADIVTNYCINDIQTNYTYKFTVDDNTEKSKILRKPYSLEDVYSAAARKNILNRVSQFEKNYNGDPDFCIGFWKDYGYTYNYKTDKLIYKESWFGYDDTVDMLYDKKYSEKL